MRPSWIEVDLHAIEHNAVEIARHIAPSRLCAVVKADAYGHGDIPVAEAAVRGGAEFLAVALVEEGIRLREADIDAPIIVLSEPSPEEIGDLVENSLTPAVYRQSFIDALAAAAASVANTPYPVHLKVDTGMHRVGASPIDAFAIARAIHDDPRIHLQGVFTHFPVSEEDVDYTAKQNTALERFLTTIAADGIEPKLVHAANTAAAFDLSDTRHTLSRVGLGLYGLRPVAASGSDLDLKPAMRVVSHVGYLQSLPTGARPSYGRIRPLDGAGRIATVPIGYADGVPRRLSTTAEVLINGKRYPYAGTVTMDMVVVDVGNDEVAEGDEVVLLGSQGDETVSADEWADLLGTINYEIVCNFGPRLPRRYLGGAGGS